VKADSEAGVGNPMSVIGTKQTLMQMLSMSAIGANADMTLTLDNVR
jgi:hypothetical protein